jgi:hypothetical protein
MSDAIIFDRCDLMACLDERSSIAIVDVIAALESYRSRGFRVVLAANMGSSDETSGTAAASAVEKLAADLRRLEDAGLSIDRVSFAGPVRGPGDMVVDDKLVSLHELVTLAPDETLALLEAEAGR